MQAAPRGSPVAGSHPAEVEREGVSEDHEGDRERRGPGELEAEVRREHRREYPENDEKPDRERDENPEADGGNASHNEVILTTLSRAHVACFTSRASPYQ